MLITAVQQCDSVTHTHTHTHSDGGLVAKSCLILVTPWTVAHQVPLSMGFLGQEYRSELPFLSPGDLPDPGVEPGSPALADRFFTP